jgi:predicted phage terminase large subunit-like protein
MSSNSAVKTILTPDEIIDIRCSLLEYTKYDFRVRYRQPFLEAYFHQQIAEALEAAVAGFDPFVIINMPPRSGKTQLAVKNFMSWCIGNWPDSEFIHASYSSKLASDNTHHVRDSITSLEFSYVFGGGIVKQDSKAKDHFKTKFGGVVHAAGVGGTITGFGAGKMRESFGGAIIIDDPHKPSEAHTATSRKSVQDWYKNTLESRKNNVNTPVIVIMQRLHQDDLTGWLLEGGDGNTWNHVKVRALDEDGQSFWQLQFPAEDLKRKQESAVYEFAGQYQQEPSPLGGGIFKDEWWQYYKEPPKLKYRMIFADTAQKTGQLNDFSVFQLWGMGVDGNIYLLDQIRGKWEAPELLEQAKRFWYANKAPIQGTAFLRSMHVEDKVSGTGLIQSLKRFNIPVFGIQRQKDKVTRAFDAAPMVQQGRVYLPFSASYGNNLVSELTAFPNGSHDDQVDPLMDAISEMLYPKTYAFNEAMIS